MKILHVVPSISHNTGGPSRSVQGLVAGLNTVGVEAWLMTLYNGVNHGSREFHILSMTNRLRMLWRGSNLT